MDPKKQHFAVDAWIHEAQDASKLTEDLQLKLNSFNGNGGDRIRDSAQSMLLELGVKLDRLESLLRNPPCNPILTDEDLEFRWKMITDIQQRFRMAAQYLYASVPANRNGVSAATDRHERDRSMNGSDQGLNLRSSTSYDADTRSHKCPSEDCEMQTPLLLTELLKDHYLQVLKKWAWKIGHVIGLVLGGALLLFVVVVIVAALQTAQSH